MLTYNWNSPIGNWFPLSTQCSNCWKHRRSYDLQTLRYVYAQNFELDGSGQKPIRKILCPWAPVNGHDTESLSGAQHAKCPCLAQQTTPNIKPLPMSQLFKVSLFMSYVKMLWLLPWHRHWYIFHLTVNFDVDWKRTCNKIQKICSLKPYYLFSCILPFAGWNKLCFFLVDGWTNHGCSQTGWHMLTAPIAW